jgi:hypothetical protein
MFGIDSLARSGEVSGYFSLNRKTPKALVPSAICLPVAHLLFPFDVRLASLSALS